MRRKQAAACGLCTLLLHVLEYISFEIIQMQSTDNLENTLLI